LVGWLLHDRDGFATPPGQLASQVIVIRRAAT
jgi:hypothetical protein